MTEQRLTEPRRTAIPARFSSQRERVLQILDRWEASVRVLSGEMGEGRKIVGQGGTRP